jgi:hypothetical protein
MIRAKLLRGKTNRATKTKQPKKYRAGMKEIPALIIRRNCYEG